MKRWIVNNEQTGLSGEAALLPYEGSMSAGTIFHFEGSLKHSCEQIENISLMLAGSDAPPFPLDRCDTIALEAVHSDSDDNFSFRSEVPATPDNSARIVFLLLVALKDRTYLCEVLEASITTVVETSMNSEDIRLISQNLFSPGSSVQSSQINQAFAELSQPGWLEERKRTQESVLNLSEAREDSDLITNFHGALEHARSTYFFRQHHFSKKSTPDFQISPVDSRFKPYDTTGRTLTSESQSVCIATSDIIGPVRNSGIATFYTSLAEALATAGHQVTILFPVLAPIESGDMDYWSDSYAARGIELVQLLSSGERANGNDALQLSFEVYRWLKGRKFDCIHFPEYLGIGYHSVMAKKSGIAFNKTTLCVELHSPSVWHHRYCKLLLRYPILLERQFLEQECIENADVVISPSSYMLDYVDRSDWKLPSESHVITCPIPRSVKEGDTSTPSIITELVFFGRLEARKGIEIFCDAIDLLLEEEQRPFSVTFLGKISPINDCLSDKYIAERARTWSVSYTIQDTLGHAEALSYLGEGGLLAVMPSLADNSPLTVHECLTLQIPFIASRVGGIPELLDEGSHETNLFEPNPISLADFLMKYLHTIGPKAQPKNTPAQIEERWVQFHSDVQIRSSAQKEQAVRSNTHLSLVLPATALPTMSELLTHAPEVFESMEYFIYDSNQDHGDITEHELIAAENTISYRAVGTREVPLADMLNLAAGICTGQYVAFAHPHARFTAENLLLLYQALSRSDSPILIPLACSVLEGDHTDSSRRVSTLLAPGSLPFAGYFDSLIPTAMVAIDRKTFFQVGGFDTADALPLDGFLTRSTFGGITPVQIPEAFSSFSTRTLLESPRLLCDSPDAALQSTFQRLPDWFAQSHLYAAGQRWPISPHHVEKELLPYTPGRYVAESFFTDGKILSLASPENNFEEVSPLNDCMIGYQDTHLEVIPGEQDPILQILPHQLENYSGIIIVRLKIFFSQAANLQLGSLTPYRTEFITQPSAKSDQWAGISECWLITPAWEVTGPLVLALTTSDRVRIFEVEIRNIPIASVELSSSERCDKENFLHDTSFQSETS